MNANNSDRDVPDAALCRKIEERAYHIWLASGRRHGDHERHWFEAERELMETAKQEREQRSGVRNGKKPVNRIKHSDKGAYPHEESTTKGERDMSRTIKAHKEAAIHESITRRESQMTYDNEAIVRNAYHTAEGNVLDIPGWIGSFTEDGVFNNVSGEASYRGEHLKDVVITFAKMFPDVHRELYRVNVMGDVVAIELAIQGTFRGPMETPAGVIQPTGAKVDIPCADFFYMRNGKIERFDCYPALNIMLKQMGVPPDFASAVKRSTQR